MSENVTTVLVIIGIFVVLPFLLLAARDWIRKPSKKKIEEYSRKFTERLQRPDFSAVQQHFGVPLPPPVQALYTNHQELFRENFEVAAMANAAPEDRWFVAFYQPADEQSARDAWPGLEKYFAFADDGCGNGYLIDPKSDDPAVLFHDHETSEISRVSERFTEFMKWPRLQTAQ